MPYCKSSILGKMNLLRISLLLLSTTIVGLSILIGGCGQKGALFVPPKEANIRFYSINEKNQQRELLLVPGAGQSGCHNLPLTRAIYRVAQIGFEFCEVFAEKNCTSGSEYRLRWSDTTKDLDKMEPSKRITPGAKWLFADSGKTKVSSWSCQISQE